MKHTIEFNLPDDSIDLAKHIDAVNQNSNFRTFIDDFEQYLRSEWKHGPSTENASELVEKIRDRYFELKESNEIVDWSKLEEIGHAL